MLLKNESEINRINQEKSATEIIYELLINCSRINLDSSAKTKVKVLLQQQINWEQLIDMAIRYGVTPLLYQSLKEQQNIPREILHRLRKRFFDNFKKNYLLTQELNQVLALFEQAGIKAIPFKGAVLAISSYGGLSLREFGDLDILVQSEDFIQAKNLLIERGYSSAHTWFLNEKQEHSFIRNNGEYSLISKDGSIDIDLHSRLVAGYLFTLGANLNYFWSKLHPITVLERQVNVFQSEENLIYLCIHGTKSFWERLIWICDVAESINSNPQLNWQYLLDQSQTIHCQRMLLLGCSLAQELLSVQLPLEVITKIKADRYIEELSQIVIQKLKGERQYPCVGEYTTASYWFYLKAMDSLKDRIFYSLQYLITRIIAPMYKIFIPNALDRNFIELPQGWHFLYYLIKPIRVIKQYL